MKALTIRQPWATLIAAGLKHVETRSWPTSYRGAIAIHAGRTSSEQGVASVLDQLDRLATHPIETIRAVESLRYPLGAVVAIAQLVACERMTRELVEQTSEIERAFGDWTPGRFAWQLEAVAPIEPIAARGKQGLWEVEL